MLMGILDRLIKVQVTPQYGYFDMIVSLATILIILYIAQIYTKDKRILALIGIASTLFIFGFI